MSVFIQLSKQQRKEMARHERRCRNQHKHDEMFPNLKEQAVARAKELQVLVHQQTQDRLRNVEPQVMEAR